MTELSTTRDTIQVLVLDADPASAFLLRQLLQLLPEWQCKVELHQPEHAILPNDIDQYDVCFLSFDYAPERFLGLVVQLATASPGLRIFALLSEHNLSGDRQETARAMRAGVEDFLARDELSVRHLRQLLLAQPMRAETGMPLELPAAISLGGHWTMNLSEHRAHFDADTLARLGYGNDQVGKSLGDWKSLIHADDIDKLIRELNQVLEGNAPPHPVSYRIRTAGGAWQQVVSDDISVQLSDQGVATQVRGSFYAGDEATDLDNAALPVKPVDDPRLLAFDGSPIAKLLFHPDPDSGSFVAVGINAAAEFALGGMEHALTPSDLNSGDDRLDLEVVMQRVADAGISEAHQVQISDADGLRYCRQYQFARLDDDSVLIEFEDLDAVDTKPGAEQAMWEQVVNSLPDVALVLDDRATIISLLAGDPGELAAFEGDPCGEPIAVLLGARAAEECQSELSRTLNTGKKSRISCQVGEGDQTRWLECRLSPLRTEPGMPRQVIWTAHDISERIRAMEELSATRQQFRDALYRVPAVLYLKDTDGRYLLVNPHFEALYGIEEEMITGKTDYEVFPDELATEIYAADRQVLETLEPYEQVVTVGHAEARRRYRSLAFPVCDAHGDLTGVCCLSIPLDRFTGERPGDSDTGDGGGRAEFDEVAEFTASVTGRVEHVLTESGDYSEVLAQLERLAATTKHAQAVLTQCGDPEHAGEPAAVEPLPLARNILALEKILLPSQATLHSDLADSIPSVHCDPVVLQQLMLRAIRHARNELRADGKLSVRMQPSRVSPRGCASCAELVEGAFVELVVEESDSSLSDEEMQRLFSGPGPEDQFDDRRQNLGEIHRLIHAQGGHLLVQRGIPRGTSLYLLLRPASDAGQPEGSPEPDSTVTRFPLGRK